MKRRGEKRVESREEVLEQMSEPAIREWIRHLQRANDGEGGAVNATEDLRWKKWLDFRFSIEELQQELEDRGLSPERIP